MTGTTEQPNERLKETDPQFAERMLHFADVEVAQDPETELEPATRYLAILATLLGCQGADEFRIQLGRALDAGLTPVQAKEVVYQAVDYLGIGRVRPFLTITNEVLEARGVALPLPDQTTTTMENRLAAGNAKQVELFGEGMDKSYERSKVNYWLADNCFGDYYTRTGLTNLQREMITFCYLAAQGSVEPQLLAHTKANIALGNTADFLRTVVLQNLPYIGYPRTLNALRIVEEADKAK
ncbi:carboxymuconolactone decarboxylase [Bifidobacterium animalis subsp. animalis]|uniref:carboxymuconolactone decarboxylase family protein n=1 Tax=Bifidobacterium animalis TaxID=28025 RepID=UPI00025C50B2|nr:carboxymuconolactone decarboxylase family protein [Bifidobacterium animalis]AFI62343.1 putative carboxymuconolactone decarboxylase [Bifidobacterium animalis subsp. animalis ATCC 25527]AYN22982.1 carboxymuconolactone decarboxylase [Bifidobacterium animalis subsp. animalis]